MNGQKYVFFDFDGTLTTKDTLPLFIQHVFGSRVMYLTFVLFLPQLVLMKLGVLNNGMVKERMFTYLFSGMDESRFKDNCLSLASLNENILREDGINCLKKHIDDGDKVVVVSASIEDWVRPFVEEMNVEVIGTKIEVKDGKLTGKFSTPNCYGFEKVKRILEIYKDIKKEDIIVYGDSKGDKEMLDFSSESHYKPFR